MSETRNERNEIGYAKQHVSGEVTPLVHVGTSPKLLVSWGQDLKRTTHLAIQLKFSNFKQSQVDHFQTRIFEWIPAIIYLSSRIRKRPFSV